MKASLVVFSLVAIIAVLLHGVVSLPPDFFRNGRGIHNLPPMHKKSSADDADLIAVACEFCAKFSPVFEFECKRGVGERRKECMLGFLGEVQNMVASKGWHEEQ